VVARQTSTFTAPNASVKVAKVDFSDHQALVNALKGNEALVFSFGEVFNHEKSSKEIIDAAIEAGVQRVIPNEFGGDMVNSPGREEPVLGYKRRVREYLIEKAKEGVIEFTTIANGCLFDWGLTHNEVWGFNIPAKTATLYNEGDAPLNMSTLASVSAAVVSVFSTPEKFKNKHLRISDFYVSQKDILAVLEAETGSKFTVKKVDAEKIRDDGYAALDRDESSLKAVYAVILGAVFGQKSSTRWGRDDDTDSLSIPKKDLTEEIRKLL